MIQAKSIDTTHGPIAYLETTQKGQPFFYFHGGLGKPGFVNALANYFVPKGCQVIAPYLPGHGRSFPLPKGFSYDLLLDAVGEFFTSLHRNRAVFFGHSLGGRLAYDLGVKYPKDVDKLVLSAPLFGPASKPWMSMLLCLLHDQLKDKTAAHFNKAPQQRRKLQGIQLLGPQYQSITPFWNIAKNLKNPSSWNLNIPTLFLWGQNDTVMPFHTQELEVNKVRNRKVFIFPGHHYYYLRNNPDFLKTIDNFLLMSDGDCLNT